MEPSDLSAFAERFSNRGRWGEDDALGTLNHVRPEDVVAAARLVRTGKVFALGVPFDADGPQRARPGGKRFNPIHTMLATGSDFAGDEPPQIIGTDDIVTMPLQCSTQWDGLGHILLDGYAYNGNRYDTITGDGATTLGIERMRAACIGRGVLLDVPRHRGVDWLEPGDAIQADELDACAEAGGVTVGRGDFVLLRTGDMARRRAEGSWGDYAGGPRPGTGISAIEWLHRNEVAAIAADNYAVEVNPCDEPGLVVHLHAVGIPRMGLLLGEIFDLEELAADCAADGVHEFLFVAPPLPVTHAVGSPINPYAVK